MKDRRELRLIANKIADGLLADLISGLRTRIGGEHVDEQCDLAVEEHALSSNEARWLTDLAFRAVVGKVADLQRKDAT